MDLQRIHVCTFQMTAEIAVFELATLVPLTLFVGALNFALIMRCDTNCILIKLNPEPTLDMFEKYAGIALIALLMLIFGSISLIVGVLKLRRGFLYPWLILTFMEIVMTVITGMPFTFLLVKEGMQCSIFPTALCLAALAIPVVLNAMKCKIVIRCMKYIDLCNARATCEDTEDI